MSIAAADAKLVLKAAEIYSPDVVEQLDAIEVVFGGRAKVVAALACAPAAPNLDYMINLLADPEQRETPLADLCARGQLRPGDLFSHLCAGNLARAKTEASTSLPRHLPQVVEDLMQTAHIYEGTCDQCLGRGTVPLYSAADEQGRTVIIEENPCDPCQGTGRRTYPPDPVAREQALKISGLLASSGPTFNMDIKAITANGAGDGPALDRLHAAMDKILDGVDDAPLDAEVVPDPPDEPEDD